MLSSSHILITLIQPHPFFQYDSSSMFLSLTIIFTPGSTFSLDTKCITFTTVFLLPQPLNLDELNYLLSPIFICQFIAHFYPIHSWSPTHQFLWVLCYLKFPFSEPSLILHRGQTFITLFRLPFPFLLFHYFIGKMKAIMYDTP